MIKSDDICIVMNANFDNYVNQFKEWFEWYKDKYSFKVYLATNRVSLFDGFVDEKLHIFDTEDLLKNCPETYEYEKIVCEKVVPYSRYPWNIHRHIKKRAFDDGFKCIISIESDTKFVISEELILKYFNNFDSNKIYTTAGIFCKNTVQWDTWYKCTKQLNKYLNLNIKIDKYCSVDGTDIVFNFDKNTYKLFFNDWDKFSLHKYSTINSCPNTPQAIILQCCANNDIVVESIGSKFVSTKHEKKVRYNKYYGS